jgi:hypothetical protein
MRPFYEFSNDLGPDTLADVVPSEAYRAAFGDGPVPMRDVPMADLAAKLFRLPGGLASWASEVLGTYETFADHGLDVTAVDVALRAWDASDYYAPNLSKRGTDGALYKRRDAARAVVQACGGNHQIAANLVTMSEEDLRLLIRGGKQQSDGLVEALALVRDGVSQREAARRTGVTQSTISHAVRAESRGKA